MLIFSTIKIYLKISESNISSSVLGTKTAGDGDSITCGFSFYSVSPQCQPSLTSYDSNAFLQPQRIDYTR